MTFPGWFWVDGAPVTQGSKRALAPGVMREVSKGLHPWREKIGLAAFAAGWREPTTLSCAVGLVFVSQRPRGHWKRSEPVLRGDAPAWPDALRDLDKLERAALDALTGRAYVDDRQVVCLRGVKAYGRRQGLGVLVVPMPGMRAGAAELDYVDGDCRPLELALGWWPAVPR